MEPAECGDSVASRLVTDDQPDRETQADTPPAEGTSSEPAAQQDESMEDTAEVKDSADNSVTSVEPADETLHKDSQETIDHNGTTTHSNEHDDAPAEDKPVGNPDTDSADDAPSDAEDAVKTLEDVGKRDNGVEQEDKAEPEESEESPTARPAKVTPLSSVKTPPMLRSPRSPRTPRSKRNSRGSIASKHDTSDADDVDIDLSQYDVSLDDFEVDNDDEPPAKSTPKPQQRKKKKKKSRKSSFGRNVSSRPPSVVVAEQFFKPFDHGWTREVVIRNTYDEVTKNGRVRTRPADVYYFTPTNQKLRSRLEIVKFLETSNSVLSIDDFTFLKDPIYHEPSEVVRMAGPSKRGGGKLVPVAVTPPKKPGPAPERRRVGRPPKKRPVSLPAESASTPSPPPKLAPPPPPLGRPRGVSVGVIRPPGALTPRPAVRAVFVQRRPAATLPAPPALTCRPVVGRPRLPVSVTMTVLGRPPGPRPPPRAVAKKHTGKRGSVVVGSGEQAPPGKRQRVEPQADRLCGMDCEGRIGIPPSLHCQVCMCMFHPECVGCDKTQQGDAFTCQGCKVVKGSVKTSAASSPAPSPAPSPGLVSSPPPLQQRPRGRTWSSPLSTVHNGDCARPPAVRYVSRSVDPSRVSGQLLSLPSGVTSRLNLGQPLQLKLGGQTFIVPPSCFISGPDGVKVLLPAGSLSSRVRPTDIQVQTVANGLRGGTTGATGGGGGEEGVGGNPAEPAAHSPDPVVSVEPVKPAATAVPPPEDQVEVRKRSDRGGGVDPTCHFHKLHFGFSCMINIFQHLSVADLLRASQVCKTWQKVASQQCFWSSVTLRDLQVTDWPAAVSVFQYRQTTELDLRSLVHVSDDDNRTWHELTAALSALRCVRSLRLGRCPATLLYAVADRLADLRCLTAESIADCTDDALVWSTVTKLNIGKLSSLSELRSLKLRAECGLALPSFSLSGGLAQLATLTHLTTLCLTTLRDVAENEFSFVSGLVNLTALELGDCYAWTAETYSHLGKLCKLESLKLVAGGTMPDAGLGAVLSQLTSLRHLELIKYVIASNLATVLPTLSQLRTFSVWPDTGKQVALINRHTMSAVSQMPHLQQLEWGIMAEGGGAVGVDNNNTSSETEREKTQCVPIQGEGDAAGDATPDYLSINDIVGQLCCHLGNTKISVFLVPAARDAVAESSVEAASAPAPPTAPTPPTAV